MKKFETNPIELANKIEYSIKQYISTLMEINTNYPNLKEKFNELVAKKNIVKGPYVEALPDFEKGRSIEHTLTKNSGFLHDYFENLPENILKRKLHKHQEKALRLAAQNKNLIVATGTGSGKTECFLYPIIDKLLKEEELNSGVRALIIYPMNALANDQLYFRLAPLLIKHLKNTNITFGRYTSDIKPRTSRQEVKSELMQNKRLMDTLDNEISDNWLLTREEMLSNPPNILITNYAMLEHILLLPRNEGLFNNCKLNTIVLDEIHTYSGAQASEVAFLLRKLKNKLGITEGIQVFGTSASLSEGENANINLIEFASNLFGEKIHSIIRGKRIPHAKLSLPVNRRFSLNIEEWKEIGDFLEAYKESNDNDLALINNWNELISNQNIPRLIGNNFRQALFNSFYKNMELNKVSEKLNEKTIISFSELAEGIFGNVNSIDSYKSLSAVLYLGMLSRENKESYPLLPCRYHIATNSIGGLCVSLNNTEEGWENLKDIRVYFDEENKKPYFQLFTCRRCGQPFIETYFNNSTNEISNVSFSKDGSYLERTIFRLGSRNKNSINKDAEGENLGNHGNDEIWHINTQNWTRVRETNDHTISLVKVKTKESEEERVSYVTYCPNCGSKASGAIAEILTPFYPGNEALSSLITHNVIESVPDLNNPELPLKGKKLITFSDNRQDAAYFAPFFQRTSNDIAIRSAIMNVIFNNDSHIFLKDFHYEVKNYLIENDSYILFDRNGDLVTSSALKEEILSGFITAELCTPINRRLSLEYLGILRANYGGLEQISEITREFIPENYREFTSEIIKFCLDTIRLRKAISPPIMHVDLTDDFYFGVHSYKSAFELYKTLNKKYIHGFLANEQRNLENIRTKFFQNKLKWTKEKTRNFLSHLWEILIEHRILVNANYGGFVINSEKIYFSSAKNTKIGYCTVCGAHDYYDINANCTTQNCSGKINYIENKDEYFKYHHYLNTYSEKHFNLRAEEHTAALSNKKRQEIESKFGESKINLLSCTTTMEMGVDLGDLEAIVCLNIPPGISNYQQRTGRAGRRAQAAPFCVTVSKNSLYDQSVFRNFDGYLKQNVSDLYVHLSNVILFRRHQYSIILRYYINDKINNDNINSPSIKDLFGESFNNEEFIDQLHYWIESENGKKSFDEALLLETYFPDNIKQIIHINTESLKESFVKQFTKLYNEVANKIDSYTSWINESIENNKFEYAANWDRRKKRYLKQKLLDFLTKHGLIPTYSFPIHSTTLTVLNELNNDSDISLDRDAALGISEYAPGSDVVANGRIWTSRGILIGRNEYIPTQYYYLCKECHNVDISENRDELPRKCSFCGNEYQSNSIRKCIEPKTFITSYDEKDGRNTQSHRKKKLYSEEARLISLATDDIFVETSHLKIKKALLSSNLNNKGKLFVVNKGPYGLGYYKCSLCNYMTPAKKHSPETRDIHKNPFNGYRCTNEIISNRVDLSHTFETDVFILKISDFNKADDYQNIARTLTEAFRFAVIKMLKLTNYDIRATFKIDSNSLEIILYDSIAGGAGYAVRLYEKPILEILRYVRTQLMCPSDCSTGCMNCICDYTNQAYWDVFKRKESLNIIETLLSYIDDSNIFINIGATYWQNANLSSLKNRLSDANEINFYAEKIFENSINDELKQWIISLITNSEKVNFFIKEFNNININTELLELVYYLKMFTETNKLSIYLLQSQLSDELIPFVWTNRVQFYSENTFNNIFEILLNINNTDVYLKTLDENYEDALHQLKNNPILMPNQIYSEIERREILTNQHINFNELFNEIVGQNINKLEIVDPYCGLRNNRTKLREFIIETLNIVNSLDIIEITCREPHHNDINYEDIPSMRNSLKQLLENNFDRTLNINVNEFGSNMHARFVKFYINDSSSVFKYDIESGIDRLMRRNGTYIIMTRI
jgi:superfamily II DNA/RNA helicase